nr:PP2C family protein-serine/threonine phosphatase [Halorhodospira sp. 9622]
MLGGDVFLAERRPDGTLVLLLGDFTGHGIGSAVGVPALAALFYDMVRRGLDSEALLETVNDRLYRNLPPEMFLAAALFEIDCRERRLGVWSGGMPRAWLLGPGGGETRLDAEGLPLAAVPGGAVEHRRLAYHPLFAGARLIACSDGLTEMASPAGVRYGEERVEALLAHTRPGEAFDALLADVAAWRGDSEAGDDLTLLGVSFDELFAEAAEGCPRASAPSA